MDLLLFKKVVSQFLHPVPVVLTILLMSWLLLVWSRWRNRSLLPSGADVMDDYSVPKKKRRPGCLGMALFFTGIMLLYWCSTGLLVNQLFYTLERQYPPLQFEDAKVRELEPEFIVILSGGHVYYPERPITSRIAGASMARLVEGLRIHKLFPNSKVVITGGVMKEGWPSVAAEMGEVAKILGLEGDVILEENARNTRENAKLLKTVLQDKPFILVTSGYHMPRAMGLFHGQGLNPIASSADIMRWPRTNYKHDQLLPRGGNLANMNTALHEYIGYLWAMMRGQIGRVSELESLPVEKEPEPQLEEIIPIPKEDKAEDKPDTESTDEKKNFVER